MKFKTKTVWTMTNRLKLEKYKRKQMSHSGWSFNISYHTTTEKSITWQQKLITTYKTRNLEKKVSNWLCRTFRWWKPGRTWLFCAGCRWWWRRGASILQHRQHLRCIPPDRTTLSRETSRPSCTLRSVEPVVFLFAFFW